MVQGTKPDTIDLCTLDSDDELPDQQVRAKRPKLYHHPAPGTEVIVIDDDATPENTQENNLGSQRTLARGSPHVGMSNDAAQQDVPTKRNGGQHAAKRGARGSDAPALNKQCTQIPSTPLPNEAAPAAPSQSQPAIASQRHLGTQQQTTLEKFYTPEKKQQQQEQRRPSPKQQQRKAQPTAVPHPHTTASTSGPPPAAPQPRKPHPKPAAGPQRYGGVAEALDGVDPDQPGADSRANRSKLRRAMQKLQDGVHQDREQLVDPRQGHQVDSLSRVLDDTAALGRLAERKVREAALHAELLAMVASLGATMARNAAQAAQQRSPGDLIDALLSLYGPNTLLLPGLQYQDVDALRHGFKWQQLGAAACQAVPELVTVAPPGLDNMMGPLAADAKLRRRVVAAARKALPGPLVRPDERKEEDPGDRHATDAIVEEMVKVLRAAQEQTVPLLELVLNPDDARGFAQTVENTFALSFLVKDARVKLDKDPQQGLLVTLVSEALRQQQAKAAAHHRGAVTHQLMMSWCMADWEQMRAVVQQPLMRHRAPTH